jgi:hypothetical protein
MQSVHNSLRYSCFSKRTNLTFSTITAPQIKVFNIFLFFINIIIFITIILEKNKQLALQLPVIMTLVLYVSDSMLVNLVIFIFINFIIKN